MHVSSAKIRIFINYLLVAAIVVASLLLVRNVISHSLTRKSSPSAPLHASDSRVTKKKLNDYASILEKNPFGPPLQLRPLASSSIPEAAAPGSLSDLALLGTVVGPEKLSYAILEDRSKSPSKQDVFAYGEMVFHFGKLVAVRTSSVEIEQHAVKYTLKIAYEKLTPSRPHNARQKQSSGSSFVKKLSDRQYEVNRKSVLQSLEQPEHILTDARLLPNIKDGKQEGFVILEVQPNGLYDNLGLKNNDILNIIF